MTLKVPEPLWKVAEALAAEQFTTPEALIISLLLPHLQPKLTKLREEPAAPSGSVELPRDVERSSRGTGFKGVYPHGKRYRAVYQGGALGVYDTAEDAALARYEIIQGELESTKAEQEEKFAVSSDAVAREEAANLQKFLDSAPRIRIGNGDSQVAPLEVTPEMEARIKAHVAAGRMSWPAGLAARDEKRAARAAREAPASASASARPADAPPLEDSADPEVAEIEDRVRRGGLQLFDTTKA